MNLVGKIFIALIMIMTLVFLGMTLVVFSTHKNWREVAESKDTGQDGKPKGLIPRLDFEKAAYANLQAKYADLEKRLDAESGKLKQRLSQAESDLALVTGERNQLQNQQAQLVQQNREMATQLDTAQKELAARLGESDRLRNEISAVREDRDEMFNNVVSVTDSLHQTEIERARLANTNKTLVDRVSRFKTLLDRRGLKETDSVDGIPPKVDGIILASRQDGMVEISLGEDDGLEKGHTLTVFRNVGGTSKFVGKIEVVLTTPDKSVAKVIPEFKQAPIQKEDRVATRLN
jgi:hypothetical protein